MNFVNRLLFGLALLTAAVLPSAAGTSAITPEMAVPVRVELGADDPALSLLQEAKIDVDAVFDGWARVYVTESGRLKLEQDGFRTTLLPHPEPQLAAELLRQPPGRTRIEDGRVPTVYHTYATLTADLQAIAAAYPNIARLISIGQSVQGRELWMMKLSDNPDVDEDEPELCYISSMHGDEVVGKELTFNLIDYLTTNYGTDARATALVDGAELWLMPSMNPDGTELGQRYNANGVDLNRNFPDQFVDAVNTTAGRQPETAAVMQWALDRRITISSNFHGGALVANYPFDSNPAGSSTYSPSPDNAAFVLMSRTYADNNPPMSVSNSHPAWDNGITNGADWYSVNGGMQDWNYIWNGGFEVLMELSNVKWPSGSQLPAYWSDNFESMMQYFELGFRGLRGIVTDALTGAPVAATVTINTSPHPSYTDPDAGDYHRLVMPGTYTVTITAPGYLPSVTTGVVIAEGDATRHDVVLNPLTADLQFASAEILDGAGGDGWLDPGETVDLAITLDNVGGTATGITATLESTGPYAQVIDADADYPDIGPGGSAQSLAPHFRISLPAGVPLDHQPGFSLDWQSDQASGVNEFSLGIGAPQCQTVFAINLPAPIFEFQVITSQIQFSSSFEIAEIRVPVNLAHPNISDLRLWLNSPDDTLLRLHDSSGGSTNDIIGTYGDDLTPVDSFAPLIDTDSAGTWKLLIYDAGSNNFGQLNQFGVEICGYPPSSSCTVDADCDDGLYCNGAETCDAGDCLAGTPPVCDDGLFCNGTDTCNEGTDSCDPGNPPSCDDGLFCNGTESCNEATDQCNSGTEPVCDDGLFCNGTGTCNEGSDSCDPGTPPSCDDGLFCNGIETCNEGTDNCDAGTPPVCDDGDFCNGTGTCNEGTDSCDPGTPPVCDDGLFCNGVETCDGVACVPGSDPCAGLGGCDEDADECTLGPVARLESHVVVAGGTFQTVALTQAYVSPVVVCSPQYAANGLPVVTRVNNVTPTSFDVRLQNPSNSTVAADPVHCLVVEAGTWNVDGLKLEAFTASSTVTDENGSWVGQAQSYGQAYANPVVLGQVMTQNDADWSVFWAQGTSRTNPPSPATLRTGKHVGGDTDVTRAAETLGVIVLEAGHGILAGVEYEFALGLDTVQGVTSSAPFVYNFTTPFAQTPTVAVVTQSAMDGADGSWAQTFGAAPLTVTTLGVAVDEDQIGDSERNHVTEQVAYAVFAGDLIYPPAPSCAVDADCDDGLYCNGAETCDEGACLAGTPPVCSDGVGCTVDSCNEATDGCDSTPSDAACDNGLYCDGAETCSATLDCQAGTAPVCDDGVGCTVDSCNETTDSCDALPDDGLCDNGSFCDGAETCDPVQDCQAASDPCSPLSCDEGADQCVCAIDADCDDGLFCNGAETCDGVSCQPGTDPCAGLAGCDEGADQCITGPVERLETHVVAATGTFQTVTLSQSYVSPVVVCSPQYAANVVPVVTRVAGVTPTSFDVRLQNPSGNAIASENVHCLVVEQGVWDVDGLKFEAFTTDSTVTNENGNWVGQVQSYGQSYSNPVVLGQVMTENDDDWSVFWSYATYRSAPPTGAALRTGKHVGADPDITRATEVLGVIVLEAGHGTLGGIEYEAALGPDTVQSVTNSPPYVYSFTAPFGSIPTVAVVTQSAMDGADGSWGYVFGASPMTTSTLDLSVDEDQLADTERSHVNEQLAYAVFAGDLVYPPAPSCEVDADCDDGFHCNGAETCNDGSCEAGTPPVCDDGVGCTVDSCNETTDGCDSTPSDAACDDGFFCNGAETCDAVQDCQAGTPPVCDDGVGCTVDSCNETTDSCDALPDDGLCDDGAYCNGAETCDAILDCQTASDPCSPLSCDESADQCVCGIDADCDDGLFCNGEETCDGASCQPGTDPCAGQPGCDEGADQCITGPVARLETHVVAATGTFQSVTLSQTYISPVVVCSPQYAANSVPVVTRVTDVTTTSFRVRLQNPSGSAVVNDNVHCLVVEQGVWDVPGLTIEAFTTNSTVTNEDGGWIGQAQSYGRTYTNPVVLGQVMTENDADWSVFWSYATSRKTPPTSANLGTGKHVGSDPDIARVNETLGVIVFEAGHGTVAGIEYEAGLSPDTVWGVVNGAPHTIAFTAPFGATPTVAVVAQSAMDGADGGWGYVFGASPMTPSTLDLAVDEDQLGDSERGHTTEQMAYAVFASDLVYPSQP